jgi:hypothetical protein
VAAVQFQHAPGDKALNLALVDSLMAQGCPVLRWLCATYIPRDGCDDGINQLQRDLIDSGVVRLWLDRLAIDNIHSSKPTAVENAAGKLLEMGLHAGIPSFDECMRPIRDAMTQTDVRMQFDDLMRSILAWAILRAGYDDASAYDFCLRRLADLVRTCTERLPGQIFCDASEYPGISNAFRDKPLVSPDLNVGGYSALPSIHDMMWMAQLLRRPISETQRDSIDIVVTWVLRPDFQSLPKGYGIMRSDHRRFHAIGWRPDLPGWDGFPPGKPDIGAMVLRTELMSHFPLAREYEWFKRAVAHLDTFRTESGTWAFPPTYLSDSDTGYYVIGCRMGLCDGRRTARKREMEATFRMLRLHRRIGECDPAGV